MLCSLRSNVRRVTSVGCAMNTGWMRIAASARSISSPSTPCALQPLQDVDEAERLRRARVAQIGAAAADAVHLLRHVDHLEVGRERADEIARGARRQRREQQLQLAVRGLVAFAVRDRELARRLDEIEQRLAALLAHELADELAEPMHVLAQRAILLREEDVRADRAGRG